MSAATDHPMRLPTVYVAVCVAGLLVMLAVVVWPAGPPDELEVTTERRVVPHGRPMLAEVPVHAAGWPEWPSATEIADAAAVERAEMEGEVVVEPPAPVAPPPPAPAPPAPTVPQGELETLICSYPWDCSTALRVAMCESTMNPGAVGGAGERGLFQIHPVHAPALGERWHQLFDPAVNVAVAHDLWAEQGWGPWTCR